MNGRENPREVRTGCEGQGDNAQGLREGKYKAESKSLLARMSSWGGYMELSFNGWRRV